MMCLNDRIREARMAKKLTQQQLSELVGCTPRMLQFYEEGRYAPRYNILLTLSMVLEVSTDYLLCRDEFIQSKNSMNEDK